MSEIMIPFDGELILSPNLDYFRKVDDFFVYHNLFGYILKMSEDVIEFLEYFRGEPKDAHMALRHFSGRFSDDMIGEFANVFALQSCLLSPEEVEEHRCSHLPYRNLCKHCLMGRGVGPLHRHANTKAQIARVGLDYFYITRGGVKSRSEMTEHLVTTNPTSARSFICGSRSSDAGGSSAWASGCSS